MPARKLYFYAFLFIAAFIFFIGCAPKMMSEIVFSSYDKTKKNTTYTVMPYGSVIFPGQWKKGNYVKSSRQQFFKNEDSVELCIAFGPANKFEFSKPGLQGYAIAKAYYEWESAYQRQTLHKKTELIASDTTNRYVIWKVYDNSIQAYYLFATPDCSCKGGAFELITTNSKSKSLRDPVQFLKDIYTGKYN